MGIALTDAIIYTAMIAAVADMRKNKFLIDDMLSQLTSDPLLKSLYGQRQIDSFREFFSKKEIFILMEQRLKDTAKYPCIVISILPGQEDTAKEALGDSHSTENVDPASLYGVFPASPIILGPITPLSYDPDTGVILFSSLEDGSGPLKNVQEGQFVYDAVNKLSYEIQMVLDDYQMIIDTGLKPDLTNMVVKPIKQEVTHIRKTMWFYEEAKITPISTDPNELLFMWSLVMYILGRYKKTLFEARGYEISTISYSQVYSESPDETNQLWARDIKLRGRVEHSTIESTNEQIQGIGTNLLIDESTGTKTPDALMDIVNSQGWQMALDKILNSNKV